MPLIGTLFNPGLRDRHWEQISEIVGYSLKPDDNYCLSRFVDMNLDQFIPKFETISEAASKEYALERAMDKMKSEWAPVSVQSFRQTYIVLARYCWLENDIQSICIGLFFGVFFLKR